MTEIVATLLIQLDINPSDYENWEWKEDSVSHPLVLGNLSRMFCYSDQEVLEKLEILYGCPGVKNVVVAKGEQTWQEYMGPDYKFHRLSDEEAFGHGDFTGNIPVQRSIPRKKRSKDKK